MELDPIIKILDILQAEQRRIARDLKELERLLKLTQKMVDDEKEERRTRDL